MISNLSFGKSKKPGIVFGQGLDYSNNIDISSTSNSQSIEKKHEEGTSKKLVEGGGFFNFGGKI